MKNFRWSNIAVALPIVLTAALAWGAHHEPQQAAIFLEQIESQAVSARTHAGDLRSFTRFPTLHAWESHVYKLNLIREASNGMAESMGEFKEIKKGATKRQNKAFNLIVSHAANLEDATEKAIKTANRDKNKLQVAHPEYEAQIDKIYTAADHIAEAADMPEAWHEFQEEKEEATSD